jgi:hypothetical protein
MTPPIEDGRGREEVESPERADVGTRSEDRWGELEARLAPLEALVPEQAPPWRAAALGVVAVVGVFAASIVALLGVVSLEHLLLPEADAADLTHGVALGIAVAAWGVLSLGVLAGAARAILGRAAVMKRRDVLVAGVLLVLLAGWTAGLHAWVVGVAGYVELDLIARTTYVWPLVVVLATVALAGARFTRGAVTVGVLALVALALLAITIETIRNAFGAIADGDVSGAGVVVGVISVAQIAVLAAWFASTVRNRYWG